MLIDVRSPKEYAHAHIPGAFNLPLFSDEERAEVGTLYKNSGKEKAIERGLALVGPKLAFFVTEAKKLLKSPQDEVVIYCARGGMRSEAMKWLLSFAGLSCRRLEGGYKRYRTEALERVARPWKLKVLAGFTGSGKTERLQALKAAGEATVDLEALAEHKGSVFGNLLDLPTPQVSCEMFENRLAESLKSFSLDQTLWIEDESRFIGSCKIPDLFYERMQNSPIELLSRPLEERADRLCEEYGRHPTEFLKNAVRQLEKKLGGARVKEILNYLDQGENKNAALLLLTYYDTAYSHGLAKKQRI